METLCGALRVSPAWVRDCEKSTQNYPRAGNTGSSSVARCSGGGLASVLDDPPWCRWLGAARGPMADLLCNMLMWWLLHDVLEGTLLQPALAR